jgi:hypothetical protein
MQTTQQCRQLSNADNSAAQATQRLRQLSSANCSINLAKKGEAVNRVRPCCFLGGECLPESVRGEACACKNSREGGVHTSVVLASTVLLGYQKHENCTLGQLMSPRSESVFFASFLCRFGQRNDVLPRTVANSDKEKSQLKQTAKAKSSNPAMTPTANPGTWQPSIDSDRQPQQTLQPSTDPDRPLPQNPK